MMTHAIRRAFVLLTAVAAAVQATACDDNTTESRLDPLTEVSKTALDEATHAAANARRPANRRGHLAALRAVVAPR